MLRLCLVFFLACVFGTFQAYLSLYDQFDDYESLSFWESTQESFRLLFANESERVYKNYFSWIDITFHFLLVYFNNFFLFYCFRKKIIQRYFFYISTRINLVMLKVIHYFVICLVLLLILYSSLIAFIHQSVAGIFFILFLVFKIRNKMAYTILLLLSCFEVWFHVNISIYNDLEASWSTYSTRELWTVTWSISSFYLLSFFLPFFILSVYVLSDFFNKLPFVKRSFPLSKSD